MGELGILEKFTNFLLIFLLLGVSCCVGFRNRRGVHFILVKIIVLGIFGN